jgi:hypothetical protein
VFQVSGDLQSFRRCDLPLDMATSNRNIIQHNTISHSSQHRIEGD